MNRNQDETFIGYCQRLTEALKNKEITYTEWAKGVVGEISYGDESLRRAATVFDLFLTKLVQEGIADISDQDILQNIERQKKQLQLERKKLQTENLEYQNHLRTQARGEMFNDKILDAIELLPQFDMSPVLIEETNNEKTGVLCIADEHYGSKIELKSLFGEPVNTYSPEIFKERLKLLAAKVIEDYDKFGYSNLIVFDLGDAVENILRISSLQKLAMGVIDAAIEYAEIISTWLVELQRNLNIPIKYSAVGGNHDIQRLLSSKKDFPEENLMKVIIEIIRLRLKDYDSITIAPYNECQFENIQDVQVLVFHGDDAKSEAEELGFWENYHEVDIDILIMGHKHSKSEQTVGYGMYGDKEVIHVNSIVGADTYSKKLRRISKAGAEFLVFERNKGLTWRTTYYLN